MLAVESPSVDLEKAADDPLSEQEVATLREHFRFLQQHRKELRLKVNAAEDLLLNGVREPTHRGVCQHLLGKVDRASVLAAAERLDPASAAKLLAGIIRFTAEIEYVLLFLEKIQQSTSPVEATAALAQALRRIDFAEVSNAQMRRVLNLAVELFDERHLPELLLGLLESPGFRDAFDASIPELPEALARLVVPLRAAQGAVLHGRRNTLPAESLRDGVVLLLDAGDRTLLRHPDDVRGRLFEYGVQACRGPEHALHRALEMLYGSLAKKDRRAGELGVMFARHLLAADQEIAASKVLTDLTSRHPDFRLPARWLEILAFDRIDRFAVSPRNSDAEAGMDVLGHHRRLPGHWLDGMRPVTIVVGVEPHIDSLTRAAGLVKELCVPGVVQLIDSGMTSTREPYFVVPNPGRPLGEAFGEKGGPSLADALQLCVDATQLLAALSAAGVELPDAGLGRFERERHGRAGLWLTDLVGAARVAPGASSDAHLGLARAFCEEVLDRSRGFIPPESFAKSIAESQSAADLSRALANTLSALPR